MLGDAMRTLSDRRWTSLWGAIHVRGVPKGCTEWTWGRLRAFSLGLSLELPAGHGPCESYHRGRTWNSLWGTICVKGVPIWAEGRHANFVSDTVGGAPGWARSV